MQEKIYECICGKTFTKPNSFNGHKSNCKEHLIACGNYERRKQQLAEKGERASARKAAQREATYKEKELKLELDLQNWLSKEPRCNKCGTIMLQKFGSGKFCSRKCSNSRTFSKDSLAKKSESAKISGQIRGAAEHAINLANYNSAPALCTMCGGALSWERRNRKVCSKSCYSKLRSQVRIATMQEYGLQHGTPQCYRYGFYNGIECDSSWELAFLLYHLDKNASIERNRDPFEYIDFDGSVRKYYPDFKLDNIYYEIKGYKDKSFEYKCSQFPYTLEIIDSNKIKKYLKYCIQTYGQNFAELYDTDRPSWLNKYIPAQK